jgi:hypothetical protein
MKNFCYVLALLTLLIVGCEGDESDLPEYERVSMQGRVDHVFDKIGHETTSLEFKDGRVVTIWGEIPGRFSDGTEIQVFLRRKNPEAAHGEIGFQDRLDSPWHADSLKVLE